MKAVDVIPLLTPAVMEKIEAIVQTKPKRPESYRLHSSNTVGNRMFMSCRMVFVLFALLCFGPSDFMLSSFFYTVDLFVGDCVLDDLLESRAGSSVVVWV
ncbi:hypothetical protein G4B88_001251 [Cannabis sativa]|uniref:Uncharacterized protein n=1 Tax=Cannabis sativa TaxID=3483 RepID=A0A7J6HZV8_CANSA|nr:hypothetical protein G4B88_001251 [Cannabis sativa]